MKGWYYAAAELAGIKPMDESLVPFYDDWYEKIAGCSEISISWCIAPGKVSQKGKENENLQRKIT